MGKVIKIIDLLNMIANREKLPKGIKYNKIEFYYSGNLYYYSHFDEEDYITETIMDYISASNLNDEVEILEDEEQEIDIQYLKEIENIESWKAIDEDIRHIVKNMNILTRAIKQLDKQIKDK